MKATDQKVLGMQDTVVGMVKRCVLHDLIPAPQRVLTARCARCDVSPARTQYMLTLKVTET